MESSPTIPDIDDDRVAALAADATSDRPLTSDGKTSLARAIERLPEAIAQSDAEAKSAK